MNYLKISNKGKIDLLSLTLLGASSKRGDNTKIGMYGSGNKYALAYLLRNNYEVSIYSGKEEIKLSTEKVSMRDKDFNCILVNGEKTSITTEFGKDWQLWQALREIYCNALDEGGSKMEFVSGIDPNEDETHFYIKNENEIGSFVANFDKYFASNRRILFECPIGRVLEKKTLGPLVLYRKGIKCFETDQMSVYDYDINHIDIDEDRMVKYSWYVNSTIWNLIYSSTNKEVIKNILASCYDSKYVEYSTGEYSSPDGSNMSEEFKEVLRSLKLAPASLSGMLSSDEYGETTILPLKVFKHASTVVDNNSLAQKFKVYNNAFYIEVVLAPLHEATLNKAKHFFTECNYEGVFNYPIVCARFDDKSVRGFADMKEQQIVISELALESGVQSTIDVLIEEYIHLKYDVKDETRSFQDAVISEIINVLKIKNTYLV